MAKRGSSGPVKNCNFNKRYLELLSCSTQNSLTKQLISSAPITILKLVSNAAIHVLRGNISLTAVTKSRFRRNKHLLLILANKGYTFTEKRKALVQKGGAAIIPLLLSTVLSALGPLLFKN